MGEKKRSVFFQKNSQLMIPVIALLILVIFNLLRDPSFFSVGIIIPLYGFSNNCFLSGAAAQNSRSFKAPENGTV